MSLSKSDYMLFLRHPAWLWLKKYEKYRLPDIDDNLQAMFDAGHEFESYAEQLFPGAVRLGFDNFKEYLSLPQRTAESLASGAKTILQGRFEVGGITCIVDVLDRVGAEAFDLIEIKSSTRAKPEHYYDLAFQVIVLEKAGIKVNRVLVLHVNNEYVRKGDIEPEKLTARTDVTEAVRELVGLTEKQIGEAFAILKQRDMPDISPRFVNRLGVPGTNWFEDWMQVFKHINNGLDRYSIYNLSYPNAEQIGRLEDMNIVRINDVPEELAVRAKQVAQIQTTRDNKRIIDKDRIRQFVEGLKYPLYFLDYETFSAVIPVFDGCQPYKDYPFQYSLHVLEKPGGKLKHMEYLHQEKTNPMPALIAKLKLDVKDRGTVLVWNMNYEKGCNDRMAKLYPEEKDFLESLNSRIDDLMVPFAKMWFVDKDFFGSASIKKVLPVLAPELSYQELEVSDGLLARRTWMETVLMGKNQGQKEKIMSDLREYCRLDTLAMVRILEELEKVIL
ncbi:MAG: DUF2779 domain-containing protein [bacterium]|nr:DUF2779 domain-containing protein [bacterium]